MSNTINIGGIEVSKFYLGGSSNVKIYLGTTKLYPHLQEPCFAVVDNISTYTARTYVDVYETSSDKWYKLNNLNQYEEYGVYGSSTATTYYNGKLVIQDGYEYQYSGSGWNNVGEISGSTATLPDVAFVLNYNAKTYSSSTQSMSYTDGQLNTVNAVKQYGAVVVDHSEDGYISVTGNTRFVTTGGTVGIGRDNTQTGCTMTIVSKARATSGEAVLTSRGRNGGSQMNWMWRYRTDGIFLHGSSSYSSKQYSVDTTVSPIIASVKTYYDGGVKQTLKDWTNNGGYSGNFGYGSSYNGGSMFCDYLTFNSEFWKGDFYWIYMSQEVLTDEQIQQVIAYNESSGQIEYPVYYDEIQDPPNNLSFSSMTEAEEYECPWVGMEATIDGDRYIFSGDSQSGYEWVYQESRLPYGYTEVEYIENTDYASLELNYKPNQDTRIITTIQATSSNTNPYGRFIGSGTWDCADGNHGYQFDYEENPTGQLHISWGAVCGWDTNNSVYGDYNAHTYDWNKNEFYIDNTLVASTTYQNFTCENNLGIFAQIMYDGRTPHTNDNERKEYLRGKLYDFKIYDDETLVADLVPCINPNNVAGVYDIVNDVFYSSAYSGYEFTAGPAVN